MPLRQLVRRRRKPKVLRSIDTFPVMSAASASIFVPTIIPCESRVAASSFATWFNGSSSYLCGMDDGWIHRCSTIYNEKYLDSYQGHTNSVYKVHWSPFVDKIFLSASADWTVRIWMIGYAKTSVTFSSAETKPILDAIWSPKFPTIFFAISDETITIWDLHQSM